MSFLCRPRKHLPVIFCSFILLIVRMVAHANGASESRSLTGDVLYVYNNVQIQNACLIDVLEYLGTVPDSSSHNANPMRGLVVSSTVLPVLESTHISLNTNAIGFCEFMDLIERSTDDVALVEKNSVVYVSKDGWVTKDEITDLLEKREWKIADGIEFYDWLIPSGTSIREALDTVRDKTALFFKGSQQFEFSTSSNLMVRKTGLVRLGNTNLKEILVALAVSCDLTLNVESSKVTFVEITPTPLPTENKKE